MKAAPRLSVIIPTYNRGTVLGKTLESVLQQTFSDYEIIVVDDGSTDGTEDSIAAYVKQRPVLGERLRYFFQPNQGKSVALNRGLSEASGEWIGFLDSDDQWLPNKLEEQFSVLQRFAPQSKACFTNARYVNNPLLLSTAFDYAGEKCHFPDKTGVIPNSARFGAEYPFGVYMQGIVVHSRVMDSIGEFDPSLWTGQDTDFLFRLSLHTTLCYTTSPLVLIDRTPKRAVGLTEMRFRSDYDVLKLRQQMFEKWLRLSEGLGEEIQGPIRSHLRNINSKRANLLLKEKRYGEARRAVSDAMSAEFTPGLAIKWCLTVVAPALARDLVVCRSRNDHGVLRKAMGSAAATRDASDAFPEGPR